MSCDEMMIDRGEEFGRKFGPDPAVLLARFREWCHDRRCRNCPARPLDGKPDGLCYARWQQLREGE